MPLIVSCPDCNIPAEITERFSLPSTDGPVNHVAVRCAAGHHFRMAADRLTIFNGGAAEAESGLGEKAAPVRHPPEPAGFHNLVAVSDPIPRVGR